MSVDAEEDEEENGVRFMMWRTQRISLLCQLEYVELPVVWATMRFLQEHKFLGHYWQHVWIGADDDRASAATYRTKLRQKQE